MRASTALAAVGAAAIGTVLYGVKGKSAQVFGPSVYRGPSNRRTVALTFDDGPSEGTLPLLDYLGSEGIPATFFQCGMNVARHPRIARLVREAGHEIGNHTYSHPRLCPRIGWKLNIKSPQFLYEEFARAQKIIQLETGAQPTWLRAPYGFRWFGMRSMQKRLRLTGAMWTVIGHDWEWPAERISAYVVDRSSPGGIVCLHDGRDVRANPDITQTIRAVRQIVPDLKQRGYGFETMSDLFSSAT